MIASKQISKFFTGYIGITGFTTSAASSDTVTTVVTSALTGAGDNGITVPLQVASSSQQGVMTATSDNRVNIYSSTTLLPITDATDNEIYGRITQATGTYTLSYYSYISGVETAYTFAATTSINFEFPYQFTFETVPKDFAVGINARHVYEDPRSGIGSTFFEQITVTGTNTLTDLTYDPTSVSMVMLNVNGVGLFAGTHFTVTGKSFSFSGPQLAAIGYNIATTDVVYAIYTKY